MCTLTSSLCNLTEQLRIVRSGSRVGEFMITYSSLLSSGASPYPMIVVRRISNIAVRIEKDGSVWTVIHDRPETRNAMDPKSAQALTAAFLEYDADRDAAVADFYLASGSFGAVWR